MRQLTVTAARARGSAGLAGRSRCLAVLQPPRGACTTVASSGEGLTPRVHLLACGQEEPSQGAVLSVHPCWGVSSGLVRWHETELQRHLREACSLLVLRQVLDTELVEQNSQMRLHSVEAQAQFVGDLLIGWR